MRMTHFLTLSISSLTGQTSEELTFVSDTTKVLRHRRRGHRFPGFCIVLRIMIHSGIVSSFLRMPVT